MKGIWKGYEKAKPSCQRLQFSPKFRQNEPSIPALTKLAISMKMSCERSKKRKFGVEDVIKHKHVPVPWGLALYVVQDSWFSGKYTLKIICKENYWIYIRSDEPEITNDGSKKNKDTKIKSAAKSIKTMKSTKKKQSLIDA